MRVFTQARKRATYVGVLGVVSVLVAAGPARADTQSFSTLVPTSITGLGGLTPSTPYPSTVVASGMTGPITKVTVGLSGLSKTGSAMKDLDFLLVSPSGDNVIFMSDAGLGDATIPLTLVFDDAAAAPIPFTASPVTSGTYQPTNYPAPFMGFPLCNSQAYTEPDPDLFAAPGFPAPAPPYGSTLSVFNGDSPNGTWKLYAVLDCLGSGPANLAGWSITITTNATAVRMAGFSAARAKHGVTVRWRTASEVDTLGFNVYRAKAGASLHKVNRALIAAHGGATGASYRFVDRSARRGVVYTYRLQVVDVDGTRTWYGSARARAGEGRA